MQYMDFLNDGRKFRMLAINSFKYSYMRAINAMFRYGSIYPM